MGPLIIRVGFGGILCYIYNMEPQNRIGYSSPYIRFQDFGFRVWEGLGWGLRPWVQEGLGFGRIQGFGSFAPPCFSGRSALCTYIYIHMAYIYISLYIHLLRHASAYIIMYIHIHITCVYMCIIRAYCFHLSAAGFRISELVWRLFETFRFKT